MGIWRFECEQCSRALLLCGPCSSRARFCPECREQRDRDSVRRAGAIYQKTKAGRENHRKRSREHRRKKNAQALGGAVAAEAPPPRPESLPPTEPTAVRVTHSPVRPERPLCAKEGASAPPLVLRSSTQPGGAKERSHGETQGQRETAAAATDGGNAQERGQARLVVTTVEQAEATLRWARAEDVLGRCSTCGTLGRLMLYDGKLGRCRGGPGP